MSSGTKFTFNDNGSKKQNYLQESSMSNSSSKQHEEFFDPKELFSLVHRYIWTILLCIIISVSGTYYLLNYYILPVYQSGGTIMISSDEERLPSASSPGSRDGNGVGNIISRSFSTNYGSPVQRAIHLFESREISREIADSMVNLLNSGNTQELPSLWLEYPEDSSLTSVERISSRINQKIAVEQVDPPSNRMESNLLEVTHQSFSPHEAAKVVNFALEIFQKKTLEQKQEVADKALTFLQGKREEFQKQLNAAEDRLVSFQNENQLVAIDAQADNSINTLSQLQTEKQSLEIQLESINSSIQNYENQMESIKPGMAEMAAQQSQAIGPTITSYQQRLAELKTQRFVLLSNNPQLKDNPDAEPQLKRLNQQINELENEIKSLSENLVNEDGSFRNFTGTGDGNLAQELSNIQRNLIQLRIDKNQYESQIQALNQRIKNAESFLENYPDKQVKLAKLQTDVQRYRQLLNNLVDQESEVALWQQTQTSGGKIVDRARPSFSPIKPNKILWLCFSALMGFVLPVGLLLLKKSLSSIINSSERLKSYPFPLLSVIYDYSLVKKNGWILNKDTGSQDNGISKDVVFYHNNDTPIAESYRKIVNQILYTDPDSVVQSLVVTSSGQGEGKTTLTANLGAAFAEVDKKVLIIDCDFRRPAMHKLFSMDNLSGINEVLFDGAKLSDAIKETGIQDLYVLTTGAKPVSPAKLLASEKFKEMIKVLKPNYDIILFDTPPYGLVSDVTSVLNLSELVIMVAKFGDTKESVLRHSLEELDKNNNIDIGLVLNSYLPKKSYDSYDTRDMHKYMYQQYYEYEKIENN